MNEKIKNVLKKLEDNGYKSFIVGGYVRDTLLNIESFDVDICTSAEPKEVRKIFELNNANDDNYGSVSIKDKLYNYDITTYRKEIRYENRRPVEYKYTDSIEDDVLRRDFTINSLYMDINGDIHDTFGGLDDINNKIIRVIGNIESKMIEDPLRMLRAVRFAATLNFELENNLKSYIKQNKQLIKTLSFTRKKQELDLIFKSDNKIDGLNLIKELNISDVLDIKIESEVIDTIDPLGIWAQIEVSDEYPFSNEELDIINKIKKIINYGIIDNIILYEYGLYPSMIAANILGYDRNFVSDIYKGMPIYSLKDIDINGDDIIELLDIEPSSTIKDIMNDLELKILNNLLKNNTEDIKNYIIENWRKES
ncbi:MAG: CCA tRNA nucleotidyltransferase [Erysipelotrichales bacterium]|nr:CCA tRNA nucleotidyltransferase [Erysipelotrichales bacterium]